MCKFSREMFRFSQGPLWIPLLIFLAFPANAAGAAKAHVITFGKWTTVHDIADSAASTEQDKPPTLKIRSLSVDARIKEFTFGAVHDVTDRVFVVPRTFASTIISHKIRRLRRIGNGSVADGCWSIASPAASRR